MASSPTHKPPPLPRAVFSYLAPLPSLSSSPQNPYEILPEATHLFPPSHPQSNLTFSDRACDIEDVRGREGEFELDVHGFKFLKCGTGVEVDFRDKRQIEGKYLREVEELIRRELGEGVSRVEVFGWKIRSSASAPDPKMGVEVDGELRVSKPTRHPHVDQSAAGALRRVYHHLPSEASTVLKGRCRIFNIWRPLATVTSYPLALCDARSVYLEDLVPKEQIGKSFTGESYLAKWSPGHRWCYLGGMGRDEVVIMKIFDSQEKVGDVGVNCCVHSSFELEGNKWEGVRESIEVRAMVFDFLPHS